MDPLRDVQLALDSASRHLVELERLAAPTSSFELTADHIDAAMRGDTQLVAEQLRGHLNSEAVSSVWNDFLVCLERAWKRLNLMCKGKPKWQRLRQEADRLRGDRSEVLCYLLQARNSLEHSVAPLDQGLLSGWYWPSTWIHVLIVIEEEFPFWGLPRQVFATKIRHVMPTVTNTLAQAVTNRGEQFPVPTHHKRLPAFRAKAENEPFAFVYLRVLGRLGLEYYTQLTERARREVFGMRG